MKGIWDNESGKENGSGPFWGRVIQTQTVPTLIEAYMARNDFEQHKQIVSSMIVSMRPG
jgi:hypothetical protein